MEPEYYNELYEFELMSADTGLKTIGYVSDRPFESKLRKLGKDKDENNSLEFYVNITKSDD